jgi:hypothetical protein
MGDINVFLASPAEPKRANGLSRAYFEPVIFARTSAGLLAVAIPPTASAPTAGRWR